jgi:hypothetical protein
MSIGRGMRSLPEHTVDCWVSAAVLAQLPGALLWAPTQRGLDNWDVAFEAFGPGKAFILENKGTEEMSGRHMIQIDMEQLDIYIRSPGAPVYYVLPVPPWPARATADVLSAAYPVPAAAQCRTGAAWAGNEPFSDWCRVVEAWALQNWLKAGTKTRTFPASNVLACPEAMKLGEFLKGAGACTEGGPRHESATDANYRWETELRQRQDQVGPDRLNVRLAGSGVLGVFLPLSSAVSSPAGGSSAG